MKCVENRSNGAVINGYALIDKNVVPLIPYQQVVRSVSDKVLQWEAQGDDPSLLLRIDAENALIAGWYVVELHMQSSCKNFVAKFYFDTGMGFNENEILSLISESSYPLRRIFRLVKNARAIRFDPQESTGTFRLTRPLSLESIDVWQARQEMLVHCILNHPDFARFTTVYAAWQYVVSKAKTLNQDPIEHLLACYNQTFYPCRETKTITSITYEEWIQKVEATSLPSLEMVQAILDRMSNKPLISIVTPVYNTPEAYLRACIDSVLAQSYPYWELCIADDCSTEEHVHQVLREYEQKDSRILVVYRQENSHISRASNSALEIAKGEYVAFLDHDDVLAKDALYFVALAICENPNAQIFYSDEDKIDSDGNRSCPHFKSDWNPDLFFSQNYVSHLSVYRRELLLRVGGFRPGVEGSQDYDLLLRCLPYVQNEQIVHIPRILYHWRMIEGSTALSESEKIYAMEAGIRALKDYFAEHGPKGIQVEAGMMPNTYRVQWPIPEPPPLVSLLIPTRDRKDITEKAVRSILDKTTYPNHEIIILDNGSIEPITLKWFDAIQKEDRRVRVIRYDAPFNFSAINNFGVRHAKGTIIGFINNDVEVISPDWLTEMVRHASRKDIGCVGAKLYYSDGRIQHGGVILGLGGVAGHSHKHYPRSSPGYFYRLYLVQNLSAVTAACMLVRRDVYEQVGGFDEENLAVAFNDVDFCLKVREAGYRNLWTPYAEWYHHESISRGYENIPEKQERFRREIEYMKSKWGKALDHDPYYNRNLTKDREDFSIGV